MSPDNASPGRAAASGKNQELTTHSQKASAALHEMREPERDAEDSSVGQDDSSAFPSEGSIVYRDSETSADLSLSSQATGDGDEPVSGPGNILGGLATLNGPQSTTAIRSFSLPSPTLQNVHSVDGGAANSVGEAGPSSKQALNPAASTFSFRSVSSPASTSAGSTLDRKFGEILSTGKDLRGSLTREAKIALGQLGLQPIPSLHGAAKFPYARNPSGVDLFHFSVAEEEPAFVPLDQVPDYQPRTIPLPLPGNSRYTHNGRLAQQRNASAPATLGFTVLAPEPSPGPPIATQTVRAASSGTRRGGRSKKPQPVTPLASTPFSPPTPVPTADYAQAVALEQARLAQQLQHAQIAQAQAESRQAFQQLVNTPLWPFSAAPVPPMVYTPSVDHNNSFASPPYPITNTARFDSRPSDTSSTLRRRPSIVIGPDGEVRLIDSNAIEQLAAQTNLGMGQPQPASNLSSRSTSWETDAGDVDAVPPYNPSHEETEDEAFGTLRPPSRAEQLDRRNRPSHRRSAKSTDVAPQAAQSYLEKGRRSSAAAFVPHPGVERKSTHAPATAGSRSTTGPAKMPQKHARPSHSRRGSRIAVAQNASAGQDVPPSPGPASSSAFPPFLKTHKGRAFSDIGNSVSSAKVTSYAVQLDQQPRHISSPSVIHSRTVPQFKLEPPTPKKPSGKQSKAAKTPSSHVEEVTDALTALNLASSTETERSTTPLSAVSEAYVTATEGDDEPSGAGGSASGRRRRKRNWARRRDAAGAQAGGGQT